MNNTLIRFLLISMGIKLINKNNKPNNKNKIGLPSFRGILEVKHVLPGRIRLYAPTLKFNPSQGSILLEQVKKIDAIQDININTITGSILINYKECEIETILLIGIIIKLLNLEGEIKKEPKSLVKKEITNFKDSLNLAIYDKTRGIIDGKTLIIIGLLFLGGYSIKNKPYGNIPGLNYIWWAYSSINK